MPSRLSTCAHAGDTNINAMAARIGRSADGILMRCASGLGVLMPDTGGDMADGTQTKPAAAGPPVHLASPQPSGRSADRGDRVAVLRPGLLVVAHRRRPVLAVADRVDARGSNAPGNEVVAAGIGPALSQRQIVFLGPAIVTVARDLHIHLLILAEPPSLLVERCLRVRRH